MTLENLINNFIEQIKGNLRIPYDEAKQVTGNALSRQLKETGKVMFEQNGKTYEFTRQDMKKAWSNIK